MAITEHCAPGVAPVAEKPILLWPAGAVPTALPNDTIRERREDRPKSNFYVLHDIIEPTLTPFLPVASKKTGAAVLVIPGGGYRLVAAGHEGDEVAQWLAGMGIAAFVLKYRLPDPRLWSDPRQVPLQDARRAMQMIRENAAVWGVDPAKVGVLGFSAGGHLASTLCTHDAETPAITALTRPNRAILAYPVISFREFTHMGSRNRLLGAAEADTALVAAYSNELRVTAATSPTFLIHAADDKSVPVDNSILYYQALRRFQIPAELHLVQAGGHGFGLARNQPGSARQWPDACAAWLREHGWAN